MSSIRFKAIQVLSLVFLLILGASGCKKRTPVPTPTPPPPQSAAAPSISFSAQPTIITAGSPSTLTWSATDATEVLIEELGKFPAAGTTIVRPTTSTTYTATATGPGGRVSAQARVTVTAPSTPPPPPKEPERPKVDEKALTLEEIFRVEIKDIFFDFDRYELNAEGQETLRHTAEILLKRIPQALIQIEGHCDERGTEEYNLALGDKRANSARDYLVSLGVHVTRIRTISYGEERPFSTGHDESSWSSNRRAHFVLRKN